jgi:hypothetical protein
MCIQIDKKVTEPKVATEDIVCYKEVKESRLPLDIKQYHGKEFTGKTVDDKEIKGIINVEYLLFGGDSLFLCTNHHFLNGTAGSDRHGMGYSWHFDDDISELMVDGVSILTESYRTPYQEMYVEIGKSYTTTLGKINIKDDRYNYNEVEEGFHTYAENPDRIFTVKCIIPKGSKYYESFKGSYYKELCSDKLNYVELIIK